MIYVVAGFGRCGTSLMMRCLQASGIPLWYDKLLEVALQKRNRDDYLINESFLECSPGDYMRSGFSRSVPEGHAIKLALRGVPILSGGVGYKMVLMERNPMDIRESFIKSKLVETFDKNYPSWPNFYNNLLSETKALLDVRRDVDYVVVDFKHLIKDTENQLDRIRKVIPLGDVGHMINPDLYRYEAA